MESQLLNRKRSRNSSEDEASDFTPLSKRINNLHINRHFNPEGASVMRPGYCPDLGPAENPFYYENNRLLYTLYLERAQRTGVVPY